MQRTGPEAIGAVWRNVRNTLGTSEFDDADPIRSTFSRLGRVALRAQPVGDVGSIKETENSVADSGPVSGGGRGPSGGRGSHGHALRKASGRQDHQRPNFNIDVPPNGYAWWYIDGIDPVSGRAISIIAFIGSVFSPWYRWSGRKSPQNHVCLNVATYGPGGRFTMTDRGTSALHQTPDTLTLGPSSVHWDDERQELRIDINEISSLPLVSRIKGTVVIRPKGVTDVELALTPSGTHVWRPFAPNSDIFVDLDRPGWQWQGHGYFDANFGTRALEQDFDYWTWGRFPVASGTKCFYDLTYRDGTSAAYAVDCDPDGQVRLSDSAPDAVKFSRSGWLVKRETRCDAGAKPKQIQSLLDAPFYSRAEVETTLQGHKSRGVFEALDLTRFRNPLILAMLAVRVPRRASWPAKPD